MNHAGFNRTDGAVAHVLIGMLPSTTGELEFQSCCVGRGALGRNLCLSPHRGRPSGLAPPEVGNDRGVAAYGPFETCRRTTRMSAHRDRSEVIDRLIALRGARRNLEFCIFSGQHLQVAPPVGACPSDTLLDTEARRRGGHPAAGGFRGHAGLPIRSSRPKSHRGRAPRRTSTLCPFYLDVDAVCVPVDQAAQVARRGCRWTIA